jgi:cell division protein FtsB
MPTRLKRPPFWRYLLVAGALIAFQVYLGFNVVSGQYGIESQKRMHAEIQELQAQSAALQASIDAYRHRVTLFDPQRLDPDIVTERARALLWMAHPADVVVMVDAETGKPNSSSFSRLADNQLIELIEASSAN